ncbi:MFS transporter [Acidiferrimicrobium sp. IK]|uniref:MFS transporter n=1 Tax=Acidiferrimicrobium sp. IK TaxID=2871700 RepID=UPI0021CB0EC3|nr:MFS transporter [Acidiferrimicrobium sp. IK]MCU4182768.1 MFS transporter [Acidiferrimicrobium sp. IK]
MEKKWWTLIAVCAGTFMLLLDVTIVNVALPSIQGALRAGFGDLQWVVDAYALSLASLLLTAGALADRFGRRLLFGIGLVVFTAGSLLCGLAQSPEMLIISRGGQGIGGAIVFATSLALLAQSFHGRERGTAFGLWGAVTGVAVALGPILGGAITSGLSWRGIFLVNVPIGVGAVLVTAYKVEESKSPHAHRPDFAGFVLLTFGLAALVYGMIRAGEISWGDPGVWVSLALAVVFLVGFVFTEAVVAHPLFDLSLFKIPTFVGGSLAALAMNGSLFAMLLYITLYLQDLLGFSALGTGVRLLVLSGITLVVSTVAGRLSAHVPVRWLIGPGLGLVGAGLLLMSGVDAGTAWTHLIPGLLVAGAGSGMVNAPLASTAVGVVHPMRSGMASGINTTFRQVGIAASIAALGSVFSARLSHLISSGVGDPAVAARTLAAVRNGQVGQAIASVPGPQRGHLGAVIHSSFASGINELFVITGIVALAGGVASVALIRSRDFVHFVPEPALAPSLHPQAAGGTGAVHVPRPA